MDLQERLTEYRRELHRFPELSMQEYETTRRIKGWLTEAGVKIIGLPGLETGVLAEVRGALDGPTILLRADIDALPVQERTGLPFASEHPGVMHACGHDFHTAAMLGAALLLQERRERLRGCVRLLFQPGEEAAQGAEKVVECGALSGAQAIFGGHNRPDLPVGTVGVKSGGLMASVDRFVIEIKGVGGHAGLPEKDVDPIVIGSQIVSALQTVVSRRISALHSAVLSVTRFTSGSTWNVIPESAELEGTVRTFQNENREKIRGWMRELVEGIAAANGAKARLLWDEILPGVQNDPRFEAVVSQAAEEEGLSAVPAQPNPGGEDFAYFQTLVPGFFVWIGSHGTEEWHHPAFTVDEAALSGAARFFARLAEDVTAQWPQLTAEE